MIIDRYLLPYSGARSFDDLPVPFRCVATDLVSGKSVFFRDGSLANTLRATMSIPGVFSPVKHDGRILADGAPQFIEINGTTTTLAKDIQQQMSSFVNEPINSSRVEKKLMQQVGLGRFNSLSYNLAARGDKQGLLISAEEKDYSPP